MFEGIDAYPLSWPVGWRRVNVRRQAAFADHTLASARDFLLDEMRLLRARNVIISTNIPLRKDGLPRSGRIPAHDPAVAVYFALDSKPRVLACDKWIRVEDNLWAIAKHTEAIRGQQRWGVGSLDQAFAGYEALPAPSTTWWAVLGVDQDAPTGVIQDAYRRLAKQYHPDAGGDQEQFLRVQSAFEQAQKSRKA